MSLSNTQSAAGSLFLQNYRWLVNVALKTSALRAGHGSFADVVEETPAGSVLLNDIILNGSSGRCSTPPSGTPRGSRFTGLEAPEGPSPHFTDKHLGS